MPTQASIDRFLSGKRIALVGVSRNSRSFNNAVYRTMRDHGYEMFPVNPNADQLEGDRCYRTVAELPDVDGALIMVPAAMSPEVIGDCADRGITHIWLHKGAGPGAVSSEAVKVAQARDLDVVDGACPLMFLTDTGWLHRMHRRFSGRKIAVA
ncbi:MAG: CoA-binding protein [Ilumatobacter sp.]|uniref:CoA-binding protein n=1 Tax=Ilumatobacter sp. TaxID=1967498 RepID=UPI00261FFAB7|nr:CoA-binding protein [Ilumatobacter sp.]MDJ0769625.1 CoA-binding protein [Ilumatobacter sp.]